MRKDTRPGLTMRKLEIQRDPIAARATADSLIKKYATSDGAPMGYVIMGRATIEIDQTPAGLDSALFWGSLAASLAIAFVVTVPVNRWLIGRGRGHAVVHRFHRS